MFNVDYSAFEHIAKEIDSFRTMKIEELVKDDDYDSAQRKVKEEMLKRLNTSIKDFIQKFNKLYSLELEDGEQKDLYLSLKEHEIPKLTFSDLPANIINFIREKPTESQRNKESNEVGNKYAKLGFGIGILAGVAGTVVGTIATGGLALPVILTNLGTIGGVTAIAGGTLGAFAGQQAAKGNAKYQADLASNILLEYFAQVCLVYTYVLSKHIYITQLDYETFRKLLVIAQFFNRGNQINWNIARETQIVLWCREGLEALKVSANERS